MLNITDQIQRYFCRERHFSHFLVQNGFDLTRLATADTVHPRDIAQYRQRWPKGPLPNLWLQVPVNTAGTHFMTSDCYDVDDGHITITYRDFGQWAWHQIEKAVKLFAKEVSVNKAAEHAKAALLQENNNNHDSSDESSIDLEEEERERIAQETRERKRLEEQAERERLEEEKNRDDDQEEQHQQQGEDDVVLEEGGEGWLRSGSASGCFR